MPWASGTSWRSPATRPASATTPPGRASGTSTRPASSGSSKRLNRGEDQAGKPIGAPAGFTVACALDPTAGDLEHELDRLTGKLDAGADLIMTQPIYAREQWDRFMERASRRWGDRLPKPVLLGVLPLHTSRHAEFLHNEVPGITIPDRVRDAMAAAGDRGAEVGLELAMELLSGIRGLVQGTYIMPSFGRYELSAELVRRLRATEPALPASTRCRPSQTPPDVGDGRADARRGTGVRCARDARSPTSGAAPHHLRHRRGDAAAVDGGRRGARGRPAIPGPAREQPTSSMTPKSSTGCPRRASRKACGRSSRVAASTSWCYTQVKGAAQGPGRGRRGRPGAAASSGRSAATTARVPCCSGTSTGRRHAGAGLAGAQRRPGSRSSTRPR